MNYSRRQLYALGEPLGESATRLKIGGRIYGGGGGNPVSDFVEDAGDFAGDVVGGVGDAVGDVVGGVGDVLGDVVGGVGDVVGGVGDAIGDLGNSIDDFVGENIPGGWTTLAEIAMAFTPAGPMGSAGVGAFSGATNKGKGGFNLQGAIMGGLQGYGVGSMTQSLASAGAPSAPSGYEVDANYDLSSASNLNTTPTTPATTDFGSGANYDITSATPNAQLPPTGLERVSLSPVNPNAPTYYSPDYAGGLSVSPANPAGTISSVGADGLGQLNYPSGVERLTLQAPVGSNYIPPEPSALETLGSGMADKASQVGQGIKNLTGFGPDGLSGIGTAAGKINAGMSMTAYSGLGAVVLEDMARKNMEDYEKGQITDTEYLKNQQMIKDAIAQAEANVRMNPYEKDPGLTAEQGTLYEKSGKSAYDDYSSRQDSQTQPTEVLSGEDSYGLDGSYGMGRSQRTLYATGGTVANYEPSDDMMSGGLANGFNFAQGGDVPAYGIGGYARGGEPRFLSGGGDGMSDSIRASIDGKQEARLADGEFVIPADVVSHLGNGSSKAGAKQLHAMMNRIRKARTGNPKQGKQINPVKLMPA
jgi:hypothetical protein